jgi:phenylacetate-coenzyme A ligase PaaK-like adenylate-forming protein
MNHTLPLIRFKILDNVEVFKDPAYGGTFTRIKSLVGRVEMNPLFVNDDGVEDIIAG